MSNDVVNKYLNWNFLSITIRSKMDGCVEILLETFEAPKSVFLECCIFIDCQKDEMESPRHDLWSHSMWIVTPWFPPPPSLISMRSLWTSHSRRWRAYLWHREGQVQLFGPRPLRAVAARRRHHQDPVQERPKRLVERRSLREGEREQKKKKKKFKTATGFQALAIVVAQVGLFPANYVDEEYSDYSWPAAGTLLRQTDARRLIMWINLFLRPWKSCGRFMLLFWSKWQNGRSRRSSAMLLIWGHLYTLRTRRHAVAPQCCGPPSFFPSKSCKKWISLFEQRWVINRFISKWSTTTKIITSSRSHYSFFFLSR